MRELKLNTNSREVGSRFSGNLTRPARGVRLPESRDNALLRAGRIAEKDTVVCFERTVPIFTRTGNARLGVTLTFT